MCKVATTWMRPVCAKIAQRAELGACSWGPVTCHVFSLLLMGFLMATERAPLTELASWEIVFETLQLDRAERGPVVLDGPRRISDGEPRGDLRGGRLSPRRVATQTYLPLGNLLGTSL